MGVPTSEVGYTSAMPRREDHEVQKDVWGALGMKNDSKTIHFKNFDLSSRNINM